MKNIITVSQRVRRDLPQDVEQYLRDRMRASVGGELVELLEDGRQYFIHLEWSVDAEYARAAYLNNVKEMRLQALVLLRNFGDAEIDECVYEPIDSQKGIIKVPKLVNGEYQQMKFERVALGGFAPPQPPDFKAAPSHCWKRIS